MLSLRTLTQKERDVLLEGAQKTWLGKARYPFFFREQNFSCKKRAA